MNRKISSKKGKKEHIQYDSSYEFIQKYSSVMKKEDQQFLREVGIGIKGLQRDSRKLSRLMEMFIFFIVV